MNSFQKDVFDEISEAIAADTENQGEYALATEESTDCVLPLSAGGVRVGT